MITLKNFIELIDAKLINEPIIKYLGNLTANKENITRGTIYIYSSGDNIDEIISLGAYAIIFTSKNDYADVDEKEIAILYTEDINRSITRYINYTKDVKVVYIENFIIFSFLKYFKSKRFTTANNLVGDIDKILSNIEIVFTNNFELSKINNFAKVKTGKILVTYETKNIYESRLVCNDETVTVNVLNLIVKELSEAVKIAKTYIDNFELIDIKENKDFYIRFIDNNFSVVGNGKSMKAVILVDESYVDKFYNKISAQYRWLKIAKDKDEVKDFNYMVMSNKCSLDIREYRESTLEI